MIQKQESKRTRERLIEDIRILELLKNSYFDDSPICFTGILDFKIFVSNEILLLFFTDAETLNKYTVEVHKDNEFMDLDKNIIFTLVEIGTALEIEIDYNFDGGIHGVESAIFCEKDFALDENQLENIKFIIPDPAYCLIATITCPNCLSKEVEVFFPTSENVYLLDKDLPSSLLTDKEYLFKNLTFISKEIIHLLNEYSSEYYGCKKELRNNIYVNVCPQCSGVITDDEVLNLCDEFAIDGGIYGFKNGALNGDIFTLNE